MAASNLITRGSHRFLLVVLLCSLAIIAALSRAQDGGAARQPSASRLGISKPMPPYIVGADISWVQAEEDGGEVFTDAGVAKDIFQILKDHGFNYIRLRVFVDPTKDGPNHRPYSPQGYCDLPHTIKMASRAKKAGMGLLIDFHYSDFWADPGKQYTPSSWAGLSFPDLVTRLHDWTRDSVEQMKDAGAEPDMVQVGNEITPGMMTDHQPDGGGSTRNWDQLARLLKAGISGVEEVDPKIIIMLHLAQGGDNRGTRHWVDSALSRGVRFDVLGESCYVEFQGQPPQWKANFDDLAKRYPNLHFVCAEIADEVRSSNDIMRSLPNGQGLGTFIWEPTQNGNRQGLFTSMSRRRRRPTTAADAATPPVAPSPTTRPGAVIPAKMGVYDQMVKDYGLKP